MACFVLSEHCLGVHSRSQRSEILRDSQPPLFDLFCFASPIHHSHLCTTGNPMILSNHNSQIEFQRFRNFDRLKKTLSFLSVHSIPPTALFTRICQTSSLVPCWGAWSPNPITIKYPLLMHALWNSYCFHCDKSEHNATANTPQIKFCEHFSFFILPCSKRFYSFVPTACA